MLQADFRNLLTSQTTPYRGIDGLLKNTPSIKVRLFLSSALNFSPDNTDYLFVSIRYSGFTGISFP